MATFLEKVFGDQNKKTIKLLQKDVDATNALEAATQALSDTQLSQKTAELRARLQKGETLDDIKHEAFALVREAARRTLGQRHYDVQLMGGFALNTGAIAEMRTGEGKTLTATTAAYLNALTGDSVHLVTVNDYLARRDSDWMGQVYALLGLTVSCIQANNNAFLYDVDIEAVKRSNADRLGVSVEDLDAAKANKENSDTEDEDKAPSTEGSGYEALIVADMDHLRVVSRREAYQADIIFGTNNEFGFDYLRDNMVLRAEDRVQGKLHFAIIDEVDSILIDEARTPLIISAPAADATQEYYKFAQLIDLLTPQEDFEVDEKQKSATLTDAGIQKMEKALGVENLYLAASIRTVHHIEQALKARALFLNDREYVVQGGEIIIIDEFTGRMMHGRRYSDGLHQAIEAKEGVPIQQESQTLATITLQNYFRLYTKLSGMTGTAETEKEELFKIYALDVVVVPTNRENIRTDLSDRVYKDHKAKFAAVLARVRELHETGQPVLLGTVSIEQNEQLSAALTKAKIAHNVLNAKNHEKEAEYIAQAGKLGAVTVATNMAGRGVDIILGGNPVDIEEARKVRDLGGLAVIGTERHEARRIDNQLRGRAGRQGDPGTSQFYVSMEDDLLRIFGSERMQGLMERMGVPDDMPIENSMVSRSIETAQKKVESRNFDTRKHLVEYDDVVNKQRDTIYRRRNGLLDAEGEAVLSQARELVAQEIEYTVSLHTNRDDVDFSGWDLAALSADIEKIIPASASDIQATLSNLTASSGDKLGDIQLRTEMIQEIEKRADAAFEQVLTGSDQETAATALKQMMLRVIDVHWIAHLDEISFLRDSINLRGYGQRDPLVEYKKESYELFQGLLSTIQKNTVTQLFSVATQAGAFVAAQGAQATQLPVNAQYSAPEKEMTQGGAFGGAQSAGKQLPEGYIDHGDHVHAPGEGHDHGPAPKGETFVSHDLTVDGEKVGRNDLCPCGSGKKYKKCHGA